MSQIPGVARKVRAVVDWTVGLPFRRDIAEVGSIGHPRPLRAEVYERGGTHRPVATRAARRGATSIIACLLRARDRDHRPRQGQLVLHLVRRRRVLPLLGLVAVILYRFEKAEPERRCPRCGKVQKLYVQVCTALRRGPVPAGPGEVRHPASLTGDRPPGAAGRLAQPGADDRVGEAEAVADDRRLLRVPVQAAARR